MERKNRQSHRLKYYDYSQAGLYFVTLCCDQMKCLFGNIVDGQMQLNQVGQIVTEEWKKSEIIRQEIRLHEFVVMPNHMHALLEIVNCRVASHVPTEPPTRASTTLGNVVKGYKSSVTKQLKNQLVNYSNKIWQRNYHDHVIRNEQSLLMIREYIENNPVKWELDRYYCKS